MKKTRLSSLKILFLIVNGVEFCDNFKVLMEKEMGKWSERLDFIIPYFKDSMKIFVVMILSIVVADFLATQVHLFVEATAQYSNSEI